MFAMKNVVPINMNNKDNASAKRVTTFHKGHTNSVQNYASEIPIK